MPPADYADPDHYYPVCSFGQWPVHFTPGMNTTAMLRYTLGHYYMLNWIRIGMSIQRRAAYPFSVSFFLVKRRPTWKTWVDPCVAEKPLLQPGDARGLVFADQSFQAELFQPVYRGVSDGLATHQRYSYSYNSNRVQPGGAKRWQILWRKTVRFSRIKTDVTTEKVSLAKWSNQHGTLYHVDALMQTRRLHMFMRLNRKVRFMDYERLPTSPEDLPQLVPNWLTDFEMFMVVIPHLYGFMDEQGARTFPVGGDTIEDSTFCTITFQSSCSTSNIPTPRYEVEQETLGALVKASSNFFIHIIFFLFSKKKS
jgi:hypothetical protein